MSEIKDKVTSVALKKCARDANSKPLLDNSKIAIASVKMLKSSVKKIMPFAKLIKGLSFKDARLQAQFGDGKIPSIFELLLKSAASSAENDKNIDSDSLYVREIRVGKDKVLKRIMPRGRGKTSRILKHYSKITIILESRAA